MSAAKSPVAPFISKLFELTNEFAGPDVCFEWSEDGTQFWVSNIEIFSRDVLPAYFKHNNYASFIRQLNIYGFRRSTEYLSGSRHGPSVEVFRHPLFIRGRKDLLPQIIRRTSSSPSSASSVSAAGSSVRLLCIAFSPSHGMQRKTKMDDDTQSEAMSVYDGEHAGSQDVAVLKAKMLHMEVAMAQLREQNQILYAQQMQQSETMNALISLLGQLGLSDAALPASIISHVQQLEQPVIIDTGFAAGCRLRAADRRADGSFDPMLDLSSPDSDLLQRELAGRIMSDVELSAMLVDDARFH